MKNSQWHLLIWCSFFLAVLLHVNFCEWEEDVEAKNRELRPVMVVRSEGVPVGGLYTNQPDLDYTAAFLCGVLMPLGFLIGAAFLLMDKPRPSFPPVRTYLEELQTGDEDTRAHAAGALANLGARAVEGVQLLARALEDESHEVRIRAAQVLARIGPEAVDALPALAKGLEDESSGVRESCARALGKIGPQAGSVVPALQERLTDESELVRLYAMEAIERIRGNRPLSDAGAH